MAYSAWMSKRNPPGTRKPRPGADFFTAYGAVISWNARREHWTVRRAGKIVGAASKLDEVMIVARETAQQKEPPHA